MPRKITSVHARCTRKRAGELSGIDKSWNVGIDAGETPGIVIRGGYLGGRVAILFSVITG